MNGLQEHSVNAAPRKLNRERLRLMKQPDGTLRVGVPAEPQTRTPGAHLVVAASEVLPADEHHTGDHLSSHTGERTSFARFAFPHVRPPYLRDQEFHGYPLPGRTQEAFGKISFAIGELACLVLSNAKELLVSRAALVAPFLCFGRLRVDQRFCVSPGELTFQILLGCRTGVLEHPGYRLWINAPSLWKILHLAVKTPVMLVTLAERIALSRARSRYFRFELHCSPPAEHFNYTYVSRVVDEKAQILSERTSSRVH